MDSFSEIVLLLTFDWVWFTGTQEVLQSSVCNRKPTGGIDGDVWKPDMTGKLSSIHFMEYAYFLWRDSSKLIVFKRSCVCFFHWQKIAFEENSEFEIWLELKTSPQKLSDSKLDTQWHAVGSPSQGCGGALTACSLLPVAIIYSMGATTYTKVSFTGGYGHMKREKCRRKFCLFLDFHTDQDRICHTENITPLRSLCWIYTISYRARRRTK